MTVQEAVQEIEKSEKKIRKTYTNLHGAAYDLGTAAEKANGRASWAKRLLPGLLLLAGIALAALQLFRQYHTALAGTAVFLIGLVWRHQVRKRAKANRLALERAMRQLDLTLDAHRII